MKSNYSEILFSFSILFLIVFLNPASAKAMAAENLNGHYYGARIRDEDGAFKTAFYEITADGNNGISFNTIMGNLGPLMTTYDIDDHGIVTANSGIINGALSPDGEYLAIGKFSDSFPPQLLFAIRQSSGLTKTVIAGSYDIYLLYEIDGTGGELFVDSNLGYFEVTDGDALSGHFAAQDPEMTFTGDYAVDYEVAPDGRLILTFTDGKNASELGPMHGVVSHNGNAFVAVDTSEEGARAYAVGIQKADFFPEDLAGEYYVTNFGYYDLDDDNISDDAIGSVTDFRAAAAGTLSVEEMFSTHEFYSAKTEATGTFTLNEGHQFHTVFDSYPGGMKTEGTLNLAPPGNVFALVHQTYFGIGFRHVASGEPSEGTELMGKDKDEDGGNDDSCFIRTLWY